MLELIATKLNLKIAPDIEAEYESCIRDLAQHKMIGALNDFAHHYNVSRLEHCLHVSYLSFLTCRKWNLDYRSAARGGLLHDFYFYNSRTTKPENGIHCFHHPSIALENAGKYFPLNKIEKDIIVKHMWPITIRPPRFKESYVVTLMDKYCASKEVTLYGSKLSAAPDIPGNSPAQLTPIALGLAGNRLTGLGEEIEPILEYN
jgi:uncharacterized protein